MPTRLATPRHATPQPARTVPHADLARGDGPVLGARHVLVHVAVPQVVHRAPRRAHHQRAHAEDGQQLLSSNIGGVPDSQSVSQ